MGKKTVQSATLLCMCYTAN